MQNQCLQMQTHGFKKVFIIKPNKVITWKFYNLFSTGVALVIFIFYE